MAVHMSIRLAWHDDGWNGHICKNPAGNSYCVGQYSYPGDLIANTRDLDFENQHCGADCKNFPCQVPCGFSINAFGEDSITAETALPGFWDKNYASPTKINLPPYTVCTWCYEKMYSNDIYSENDKVDYEKRRKAAEDYFAQFEPNKSLVFYYAGYSNPFSENEEKNYVVVGVSRIKEISPMFFMTTRARKLNKNTAELLSGKEQLLPIIPKKAFAFLIIFTRIMRQSSIKLL